VDISCFMRTELVFLDIDAQSKMDAFQHIVNGMVQNEIIDDPAAFLAEIVDRENQSSTCIGRGIALPHTRTVFLDQPIIAFARARKHVNFSEKSTDSVRFIFLMGTPAGDPGTYLKILGNLCRRLRATGFRDSLETAVSAKEILGLFSDESVN